MNILFVEDDIQLQTIMAEEILLEVPGVDIQTASNGAQALELFSANSSGFDLVVTDHNLGDMEGQELSRKILAIRPNITIILVSGFVFDDEKILREGGFYKVLSKLEPQLLIKELLILAESFPSKL